MTSVDFVNANTELYFVISTVPRSSCPYILPLEHYIVCDFTDFDSVAFHYNITFSKT